MSRTLLGDAALFAALSRARGDAALEESKFDDDGAADAPADDGAAPDDADADGGAAGDDGADDDLYGDLGGDDLYGDLGDDFGAAADDDHDDPDAAADGAPPAATAASREPIVQTLHQLEARAPRRPQRGGVSAEVRDRHRAYLLEALAA